MGYVCHLFWLFCLFIHSCLSYDCAYSSNFFVSSSFPVDYPIFSNSWNSLETTWIDHFQLCFQALFVFLMSCPLCHCLLWISCVFTFGNFYFIALWSEEEFQNIFAALSLKPDSIFSKRSTSKRQQFRSGIIRQYRSKYPAN